MCVCGGVALERLSATRLPGVLLAPVGLAALIVVAQPFTLTETSAQFVVPATVGLTAAGLLLLVRSRRWGRIDPWAVGLALAVFAVFAAPVALSGDTGLGGYIKLDDNASWLALAERAREQGDSFAGLAPSSYEATLEFYLGSSYPLGGLLPLAAGGDLLGHDAFWLYQPYLSFIAAMLALALYAVSGSVIESRPLRAIVAFLASQPAILFAYTMWGGFKELLAAAMLAVVAVLVEPTLRGNAAPRALLPLAVAIAATLGVLSAGGAVWLVPFAVPVVIAAARRWGRPVATRKVALVAGQVAAFSVPPLLAVGFLLAPASSTITEQSRLANLIQPLSPLQLFGIWPTDEFRLRPDAMGVTYLLIAALAGAAGYGGVQLWRRREWTALLYVGAVTAGAVIVYSLGSPWVDAKALAIGSPAIVLAAGIGAVSLATRGRRIAAVSLATVIAGGILWSNFLAYQGVNVTPHDRFAELEAIGKRIAGQGPTLMTEYEPFGVRYFLRDAAPEGASELRRRVIPLARTGKALQNVRSAEIDAFSFDAVAKYRTLVLRRTPVASRPPSPYTLRRRGRYYETWERTKDPSQVREHLGLGRVPDPGAVPACTDVLRLAGEAGPSGRLAVAPAPPTSALVDLGGTGAWPPAPGRPGGVLPEQAGSIETTIELPLTASYELFLAGSLKSAVEVRIDGRMAGSARHELNHADLYLPLGTIELDAGLHAVELTYRGPDLHPGSRGAASTLGPLFITPRSDPGAIRYVKPEDARSLCGRRSDWIEALR
jgi:hypothetical protein